MKQFIISIISELDERMQDLKNELQSFEGEEYDENHKRKAIEALRRMENWNLFSDTHEVCHSKAWILFYCFKLCLALTYNIGSSGSKLHLCRSFKTTQLHGIHFLHI